MTDGQLLGVLANQQAFSPAERGQAAAEIGNRLIRYRTALEQIASQGEPNPDATNDHADYLRRVLVEIARTALLE